MLEYHEPIFILADKTSTNSLYIKAGRIVTDVGFFISHFVEESTILIDKFISNLRARVPISTTDPYIEISIKSSDKEVEIIRRYYGLIDALSAIGGLVDVFPVIVVL